MRIALPRLRWKAEDDPYWDAFINRPPVDPNNLVPHAIRAAADGQVFPAKSETHTPEVTAQHIKELALFFGASLVGVARLSLGGDGAYPFAIVAAIASKYDPEVSPGIGGQAAALTGAYVSFNIAAAIREFGFHAQRWNNGDVDRLAVCAGLGKPDSKGHLVTSQFGRDVYVAEAVLTDIPLSPDTQEVYTWVAPTS
jgi:hypothetical protein